MKAAAGSYYGVLEKATTSSDTDLAVEEISRLGYAVVDAGLSDAEVRTFAERFDAMHVAYVARFGLSYLQERDEHHTIRLPLAHDRLFLDLARNARLQSVVARMIAGKFVLNQQNGIINPVNSRYNQDAWHRDLPYQHFVSSRAIAVNALYCVDEFTEENGATSVLVGTHQKEIFPSDEFIGRHARQITAPAGSFIVVDCMAYHRGQRNRSDRPRRAINHVFTIPFIKQQISIPAAIDADGLDEATRDLLGYPYVTPPGIGEFLAGR